MHRARKFRRLSHGLSLAGLLSVGCACRGRRHGEIKLNQASSTALRLPADSKAPALLLVLRVALLVHILVLLLQGVWAGLLLSGDHDGRTLHEVTAKALVLLTLLQLGLAGALRRKNLCPLWIPWATVGLLVAYVVEFSAGHFHHLSLHVPLGMAILVGVMRQLLWAVSVPRNEPRAV